MKLFTKLILCFFAGLLCFLPTRATAENRALIIGIGKYQLPSADLPGIHKDVGMMKDTAKRLGYKESQIKVILDEKATLKNIQKAINEWLVKGVGPNDYVLLYYTGHGSQIYDKSGDEPDRADEVLVCHDAKVGANTLNNVFTDDMFDSALAKIPTRNTFILIDACHSGTATRSLDASGKGLKSKFLSYPGMPRTSDTCFSTDKSIRHTNAKYAALSAAQDNQKAQASNQGSFFTLGVSKEIAAASTSTKRISMNKLLNKSTAYIETNLKAHGRVHRPALNGDTTLSSKNMFIPKRQNVSTGMPESNWSRRLRQMADNADYSVSIRTNGSVFKVGDKLRIRCTPMIDGYLNVVNINPGDKAPTILFPNKFHPDNKVRAGKTISIPAGEDKFDLITTPPLGESLIVVFHSPDPVNFHRDGYGDGVFKTLSMKSTRGFVIQERVEEPEPEPEPAPAAPAPVVPVVTAPEAPPAPAPSVPTKPKKRFGAGILTTTIK